MKKFDETTFDIESTTIRELNSNEIDTVGGGTGTTIITPITVSLLVSCIGDCGEEQER